MATTTSSGTNPRKILIYVGAVVALAAVLYAAFGMGDQGEAVSVEDVAGDPQVEGEPLPPAGEDPNSDPTIGSPAPVATGTGFDGEEVTVGDGDSEVLVFLASWCPACQEEVPELVDWIEEGNLPDDVEMTGVVTMLDDNRPNWPPQEWLEEEDFEQQVLVDDADSTVSNAFGLNATPYFVAIHEGEVQARVSGQLPMEQVEQLVSLAQNGR